MPTKILERRDSRQHQYLEKEIPADNPGHELANATVRVEVCRARERIAAGKLGIGEARQDARKARDDVRQGNLFFANISTATVKKHQGANRRPRVVLGRDAGQDKDARPDGRADADADGIPDGQHLV